MCIIKSWTTRTVHAIFTADCSMSTLSLGSYSNDLSRERGSWRKLHLHELFRYDTCFIRFLSIGIHVICNYTCLLFMLITSYIPRFKIHFMSQELLRYFETVKDIEWVNVLLNPSDYQFVSLVVIPYIWLDRWIRATVCHVCCWNNYDQNKYILRPLDTIPISI